VHELVFTAFNRPEYLRSSVASWNNVRNLQNWDTEFFIEPSEVKDEVTTIALELQTTVTPNQNPEKLGVLVNPWNALNTAFENGADFVVLAEDDILVSSDILEYFEWANEEYATAFDVLAVNAFSNLGDGKSNQVVRSEQFSPLVWGTWRSRWENTLRDTWDKDYSSGNDDGSEAGWDWNINRLLRQNSWQIIKPVNSRSTHIGIFGTHMTPEDFDSSQGAGFETTRGRQRYHEI
jgi:hypothetical protein